MTGQKWWQVFFKKIDPVAFFFLVVLVTVIVSSILAALLGEILGTFLPQGMAVAKLFACVIGSAIAYLLVRLRKKAC